MAFIPYLGALAAILTTAAYIPQAYRTIKMSSTSSLSLPTYLLLFVGTVLWTVCAVYADTIPVLVANAVTAVLSGIILWLKLTTKPKMPAAE